MTSSAAACGDWGTGAIQRPGRLHIDDELEADRLLDRQVGGLSVSEDGLILGFRLAAAAAMQLEWAVSKLPLDQRCELSLCPADTD
jgi:hypothetical protein